VESGGPAELVVEPRGLLSSEQLSILMEVDINAVLADSVGGTSE
jgi:hypothetical protein